jgi:KDO2-lipid IV(A) lauroyltransferase
VFSIVFRCFARVPLPWLHRAGALLGWFVLIVSPSYRRDTRENLLQAGYQGNALLWRAAAEAGKGVLELPFVWLRERDDVLARTTTRNWALINEVRARGQGIIFLTPHLGCFEITAQHFAVNPVDGAPITVLYRPPRKDFLHPLVAASRGRPNLILAPADLSGVRRLLRALKRGEAIGLLPDQVPSRGEGVWATFFGRPAYTMTLPAKLHELTGAAIVLAWGERLAKGAGWIVHIAPFDAVLSGNSSEQAAQINSAMEALVRRCPEQYFWGYRRYKRPRGVALPSQ